MAAVERVAKRLVVGYFGIGCPKLPS